MLIAQLFVEFIFYSFLGWVWESIYCTINEKKWADRGFLFGPVCPIYGACVVAVSIVFGMIPVFSKPDFPIWGTFLICMAGSAVAEFGTSWVLEKRFHARWWDYSKMPLNIQGRICLPVSIAFGAAGVAVVKFLLPVVNDMHRVIPGLLYEIGALVLAMAFGADFALTEASLSALLKDVEKIHSDFVKQAQENYEKIASARHQISEMYASNMTFNQQRILESIAKFTVDKKKTQEHNTYRQQAIAHLQSAVGSVKEKRKEIKKLRKENRKKK